MPLFHWDSAILSHFRQLVNPSVEYLSDKTSPFFWAISVSPKSARDFRACSGGCVVSAVVLVGYGAKAPQTPHRSTLAPTPRQPAPHTLARCSQNRKAPLIRGAGRKPPSKCFLEPAGWGFVAPRWLGSPSIWGRTPSDSVGGSSPFRQCRFFRYPSRSEALGE